MRTQIVRIGAPDEGSWRMQPVDPTGWLAGTASEDPPARTVDVPDERADRPASAGTAVRRRRPRRSAAARAARERELARRRRRRHGRSVLAVDRQVGAPEPLRSRMNWSSESARRVRSAQRIVEPAAREVEAGYRIGRWGRLALTVLVAATVALAVGRLVAGAVVGAASELVDVTVRPGDTLWSIASAAAPDRDPREVVEAIRGINDLPGDVVRVGEVLRVPTSSG